jgi:hypothetical protein
MPAVTSLVGDILCLWDPLAHRKVPPQSQKGIVIALGLDGDGLRRLAMAAIQEGVSGRYSSAIVRLGIFRDAHQHSNRICSMRPSECRNIFVTFRPARRVAGLAGLVCCQWKCQPQKRAPQLEELQKR